MCAAASNLIDTQIATRKKSMTSIDFLGNCDTNWRTVADFNPRCSINERLLSRDASAVSSPVTIAFVARQCRAVRKLESDALHAHAPVAARYD